MRRWWNRLSVLVILAIAAGSIYAVWPDEPDRYLPDWVSLPSGRGLPSKILGIELPCRSSDSSATNPAANCRGMTLGLDLQGGSRITLQADVSGLKVDDTQIDEGLDAAKSIVENRINPFGVSESTIVRSGKDRLVVELPGVSAQTARDITRPAVLMFCEGLQPGGQGGGAGTPLGTVPDGRAILYKPGTCQPDIDASGQVATLAADGTITRVTPQFTTTPQRDNVVWIPAKGDLNGSPTIMTGSFLKSNTSVQFGQLGEPLLVFNMNKDGEKVFGSLSQRLVGLPLATFLDGEPVRGKDGQIIAPTINSQITDTGQTTGLSLNDAKKLKTFLNNGAFPIPLKVVQQQDVDATLGDKAVLHSVQAGLVALLLIMAFMTLYYRLPGAIASLALGGVHGGGAGDLQDRHPGLRPGDADARGHRGVRAVRRHRRGREHPDLRAYEGGAAERPEPDSGGRGGLLARVDVDPRQQHLNADHVRHPVLDGQRVRVEPDQRLRVDAGHRRRREPVFGDHRDAVVLAAGDCDAAGAAAVVVDGRQAGRGHADVDAAGSGDGGRRECLIWSRGATGSTCSRSCWSSRARSRC